MRRRSVLHVYKRLDRLTMFIRQNGRCACCGKAMVVEVDKARTDDYATFTRIRTKTGVTVELWCRRCNEETIKTRLSNAYDGATKEVESA